MCIDFQFSIFEGIKKKRGSVNIHSLIELAHNKMDYISRKSYISLALKAAIIDLDLQKQQPVLEYLLTNLLSQTYSDLAKELSEKINPKEQNISLNAMQALENEYPLKGG